MPAPVCLSARKALERRHWRRNHASYLVNRQVDVCTKFILQLRLQVLEVTKMAWRRPA